jgi:hypothetical protein
MNALYEGIDKIVAEKDAEIAALQADNARMREALARLREIEWSVVYHGMGGHGNEPYTTHHCPLCGGGKPDGYWCCPGGHRPDCWLAAAISAAEDNPC